MAGIPLAKGKFAERVIERDYAIAVNQYSLAGLSRYSAISYHGMIFDSAIRALAFMKAQTYNDERSTGNIYRATTPLEAGRMGDEVANCDPGEWNDVMPTHLRQVCQLKFEPKRGTNKFNRWLLGTGDKEIIYCSSWAADDCYSCGLDIEDPNVFDEDKHRAPNLLGRILMGIRSQLRGAPKDGEEEEEENGGEEAKDAGVEPPKKTKVRRATKVVDKQS